MKAGKKQRKWIERMLAFLLAAVFCAASALTVYAEGEEEEREKAKPGDLYLYGASNAHREGFNVPTQVYSVNGEYFIADAYNHQILYTNNYYNAPGDWQLMGDKLYRPHAIASDGTIYVVVDTDNNRIVTYAKTEAGFQVIECFDNVGERPHYIEYDAKTKQFYVWSSMTGTMYIYKRAANGLTLTLKKTAYIKDLDGCYTRSFTIDGNRIYLPSMGRNAIYVVNKSNFKVIAVYPVSAELGGMVQVRHEQNYYYLVTSTDAAGDQSKATIVRSSSLSGFVEGSYEDIRGKFPELDGIPYYITHLEDGHYYTPVIVGQTLPYICRFDIINDEITNVVNIKF
ncbi:MAG: hypothetical protein NC420_10540 [Eubacterium sp.]|nr:hypothetical protein [Eubacterium sp.]MCM1214340.1 hypothetical protein [Lachnospiraceae bacterium]MCM1305143.1 hypothetical protein [Butyrivibrio sp.]MCM1344378.1 hypothetical protein [Muribaculaceae bacterium]MCM1238632.1 hypothetical protein [Lachnospiraceae bacterium]